MSASMNRRQLIAATAGLAGLGLAGCAMPISRSAPRPRVPRAELGVSAAEETYARIYGPMPEERFPIPAVDLSKIEPRFYRQLVDYPMQERAGTIIVDTSTFHLYLVGENGTAMRYGVGLGRAGFEWSGRASVGWKQEWPKWTPPNDMIARQPELAKWSADNGGMPPGLDNPLGARALYIFQGNEDTLYRIHGSPEYWTIGNAVSSGCVRMINQDVIDLYQRVAVGSPIVVT